MIRTPPAQRWCLFLFRHGADPDLRNADHSTLSSNVPPKPIVSASSTAARSLDDLIAAGDQNVGGEAQPLFDRYRAANLASPRRVDGQRWMENRATLIQFQTKWAGMDSVSDRELPDLRHLYRLAGVDRSGDGRCHRTAREDLPPGAAERVDVKCK